MFIAHVRVEYHLWDTGDKAVVAVLMTESSRHCECPTMALLWMFERRLTAVTLGSRSLTAPNQVDTLSLPRAHAT